MHIGVVRDRVKSLYKTLQRATSNLSRFDIVSAKTYNAYKIYKNPTAEFANITCRTVKDIRTKPTAAKNELIRVMAVVADFVNILTCNFR